MSDAVVIIVGFALGSLFATAVLTSRRLAGLVRDVRALEAAVNVLADKAGIDIEVTLDRDGNSVAVERKKRDR